MSFIEGIVVSSLDWDNWDVGDISLTGVVSFLLEEGFSCSWRITVGNGIRPISSLSKAYQIFIFIFN